MILSKLFTGHAFGIFKGYFWLIVFTLVPFILSEINGDHVTESVFLINLSIDLLVFSLLLFITYMQKKGERSLSYILLNGIMNAFFIVLAVALITGLYGTVTGSRDTMFIGLGLAAAAGLWSIIYTEKNAKQ